MKVTAPMVSVLLLAWPLQAATMVFNGILEGSQEVPSVASPGTGTVELTVDTDSRDWSLSGLFSGLTGNTNNAHIHAPAAPGANASPIVLLTFTSGATEGTLSGNGTFSETNYNSLLDGLLYVNVHTTTFGGGEVRAQLVPEPSVGLLSLALGGFLLVRRNR